MLLGGKQLAPRLKSETTFRQRPFKCCLHAEQCELCLLSIAMTATSLGLTGLILGSMKRYRLLTVRTALFEISVMLF